MTTMMDLLGAIATVALLAYAVTCRPDAARCPPGWYVEGIHSSGIYSCRRAPGGDPLYDGAGGFPDRSVDRPGWYRGRIVCTGGRRPIVVLATHEADARIVGCQ